MSTTSRRLLYDIDSHGFLTSYQRHARPSSLAEALGRLCGLDPALEVHFVRANDRGEYVPAPLADHALTFKLQRFDRAPERGTYTLTYKDETTKELDILATYDEISEAINALTTVIDEDGVEILAMDGPNKAASLPSCACQSARGRFYVQWKEDGVREDFTITYDGLAPESYAFQPVISAGTVNSRHLCAIHFHEQRLAEIQSSDWTALPSSAISITQRQAGNGSQHEIQRIAITGSPVNGCFALNIDGTDTPELSIYSAAIEIRDALRTAASSTVITVTQTDLFQWDVEWLENASQSLITSPYQAFVNPEGFIGQLQWNEPLFNLLSLSSPNGFEADAEIILTDIDTARDIHTYREKIQCLKTLTLT